MTDTVLDRPPGATPDELDGRTRELERVRRRLIETLAAGSG